MTPRFSLLALALVCCLDALGSPAVAQSGCGGQFPGGTICGNNGSSQGLPGPHTNLFLNKNAAALPSPLTGTMSQLGNADGTPTRYEADAFGSTGYFSAVVSGGTNAAKTALSSGTELGGFNVWGYNGSAFVGPRGAFRCYANQNWTTGANGTYCDIATTPNGATAEAGGLRVENDGGITVPSTVTGGDQGAGTINAGGLFVNGVAVPTTASSVASVGNAAADTSLTLTGTGSGPFTGAVTAKINLGNAQTWLAPQTFTNSDIKLLGSSTGAITFTSANASATNYTITFPAITDTLATLTATQTLTNKTISSSTDIVGGVTMTLGSDATGDTYYRSAGGILTRLGIGSTGNVLTVAGGLPAWGSGSGSLVTNFSAGTTGLTPSTATTGAITLAGTLGTANGGTNCSTASGACLDNITGFSSNGILNRTGAGAYSFLATGTATNQVVLGGTITAGGPIGSATAAPVVTWNAAGQLTAVSTATITPAVGSITGLGTGVATALGNALNGTSGLVGYSGSIGAASGTSLALGGATIGSNALAVTGATLLTGSAVVTTASVNTFLVTGVTTNSAALNVDTSTVSSVTGLNIKSAASGNGVALTAYDTGANTGITLNAKGSGTIGIGTVSTGPVTITPPLTLSSALTYGSVTLNNAVTGTGNMVLSSSPTLSSPTLSSATFSGTIPATTVNGQSCALAGSCTITAVASAITYGSTTAGTSVGIPYNASNGGTLSALAVTSGGILYGSSSTVPAFSAALTQYGVVLGGGAGGAPTATAAGTTSQVLQGGSPASFVSTLPSTVQGNITQTGTVTTGTWSSAFGGTITGNATFSGNITHSGQGIFTGTSAPASASGQTVIMGNSGYITMANDGQALLNNNGNNGAGLQGRGAIYDISLINRSSTTVLGISAGTNNIVLAGRITAASLATTGTISGSLCQDASGNFIYNSGGNCYASGTAGTIDAGGATTTVANGTTGYLLQITGTSPLYANKTTIASVLTAGTGISISGTTNATITNSGVTSATGGTGIGVSGSTGSVTFNESGPTHSGRLAYVSGTSLSFAPYNGEQIRIAGTVYVLPSGGLTGTSGAGCGSSTNNNSVYVNGTSGQALSSNTLYYVYVFNNSGTLTCDFSTTGHATSTTAGNIGTEIKSGDNTRTLIGMVETVGSANFSSTPGYILSWYNRQGISTSGGGSSNPSTSSNSTVNLGTSAAFSLLSWSNEAVYADIGCVSSGSFNYTFTGIGLNGSAGSAATVFGVQSATYSSGSFSKGGGWAVPSEGFNAYWPAAFVGNSASTTFYNCSGTGMTRG